MRHFIAAMCLIAQAARAAPVELPATYKSMFDKDRAWTYRVTVTAAKAKPVIATVTCKVAEVATLGAARVSRIACDGPFDDDPNIRVDGIWAATAAGVNRIGEATDRWPSTESAATNEFVVLAAHPKVATAKTVQEHGGYDLRVITHPDRSTWCVRDDSTHTGGGAGDVTTRCFANGGLVRATLDWRADPPHSVTVQRDDDRKHDDSSGE